MNIKSIWAWVIRPFTEVSPMSEVETASLPDLPPVSEAALLPMPAVVAPKPASALNTDTLKAVLTALGHDLDAVWDDAIALARKAL